MGKQKKCQSWFWRNNEKDHQILKGEARCWFIFLKISDEKKMLGELRNGFWLKDIGIFTSEVCICGF